jgi:hypothetical protein
LIHTINRSAIPLLQISILKEEKRRNSKNKLYQFLKLIYRLKMKKETQSTTNDRPYSLRDHSSKPKVTIPAINYHLNNYQGIPFPSSNVSNGSPKNNSHLWRKGKWFDEEESYTEKLIEAFIKGYLNIPGGTTLRSFLSEQLCW